MVISSDSQVQEFIKYEEKKLNFLIFWGGGGEQGSSVRDPRHFVADPDPRILTSD